MDQTEIVRLAAAVSHLRPDWPQASLVTFLTRELAGRAYRDAAVALVWVACDDDTRTPRRVLEQGPWWQAVNVEKPQASAATPDNTTGRRCRSCNRWTVSGDGHDCRAVAGPGARQRAFAEVEEADHG